MCGILTLLILHSIQPVMEPKSFRNHCQCQPFNSFSGTFPIPLSRAIKPSIHYNIIIKTKPALRSLPVILSILVRLPFSQSLLWSPARIFHRVLFSRSYYSDLTARLWCNKLYLWYFVLVSSKACCILAQFLSRSCQVNKQSLESNLLAQE